MDFHASVLLNELQNRANGDDSEPEPTVTAFIEHVTAYSYVPHAVRTDEREGSYRRNHERRIGPIL